MKNIFTLLGLSVFFIVACSDDESVAVFCEQTKEMRVTKDTSFKYKVKNNAVAVEFVSSTSDNEITAFIEDTNLFFIAKNEKGVLNTMYTDVFSTHSPRFVLAYFKEGGLSCEKLETIKINLESHNQVIAVRNLYTYENKITLYKECNFVEVEINATTTMEQLREIEEKHGLKLSINNPITRETEDKKYYFIDESGQRSTIDISNLLFETNLFSTTRPFLVSME